MIRRIPVLAFALLVFVVPVGAQQADRSLTDRIAEQDSLAFAAFNAHDLSGLMSFFAPELEFFHDADGALTHADVEEGFRSLFAQDNGLRRDLVPGSVEVYPIPGYGAMQIGEHRFCHDENGRQDCGVFGFALVWKNDDGRWRMTRVLSYGH